MHGVAGGAQARAAGVLEGFAGLEQRLMTDHAQPLDLFGMAVGVADDPVARNQLRGHVAGVGDRDGIGKPINVILGRRLLGQVLGDYFAGKLISGHGEKSGWRLC